jgi:hypothetical protein
MVRGLDYRAIFRDDVDRRDFCTQLGGLVEATTLTVYEVGDVATLFNFLIAREL